MATKGTKDTKISDVNRSLALIVCGVAFVAGCRGNEPQKAAAPAAPAEPAFNLALQSIAAPAQGTSSQPQLTASDRGVVLSWMEQKGDLATLKFAELASDAWSPATTVASDKKWFISDADVPTVMRMSDGTLVAATYPLIDYQLEAYELRLAYSKDEGKTWSKPVAPHHDKTKQQHGFASLFEMPDKSLGVVWLDGRDMAKDPEKGAMDVYFASFDSSWKQTAESAVNARVCECCQTSAAITADGPIVAFRDRTEDDIRDIHVTRVEQGKWTDPVSVHDDKWKIDACPVNGPAVAARGKDVVVAWFTALDDNGKAYAAFSHDSGRTWGTPIRLDDSAALGHVDVELLDDGSAVATWVEFVKERSQFRARKVLASGERSKPIVISGEGTARVSGYPHVTKRGSDLVFAWTESSGPDTQQLRTAIAKINK